MVPSGTANAAALCCFIQESNINCGEVRGELYPPGEQRGGFFSKFRKMGFKNEGTAGENLRDGI